MRVNPPEPAPGPQPDEASTRRKRGGRPSAEHAGEADQRILDAATTLFLRAGFDATSCDQVVALAGAGKATLYARYANKDALFGAVVRRILERRAVPLTGVSADMPLQERLRTAGHGLLEHVLTPEWVALLRVCIATAHRLPDLSRMVDRMGRDGSVAGVVHALAGPAAASGPDDAARAIAERFVDMVLVPQQMRALVGDDPAQLAAAAPRRIDDAIEVLARAGLLDAFEAGWGTQAAVPGP